MNIELGENNTIVNEEFVKILKRAQELRYRKSPYRKKKFYDAYVSFLDWVIRYINEENIPKHKQHDEVVNNLFLKTPKIDAQYASLILYVVRLYANRLKEQANRKCVNNYLESIIFLVYDMGEAIVLYESIRKKVHINEDSLSMGYRKNITPHDLSEAAKHLVFFYEHENFSKLDFRNISPCSTVLIRQTLELLGRNMIGYQSIKDEKGKPIKKMTHISWDFLIKKKLAGENWRVTLPLNIKAIKKLNQWANDYVHNPWIDRSYIRYFGLDILLDLMQSPKEPVTCYNGKKSWNIDFGDFRIYQYNNLKKDFETFVLSKKPDAKIDWLPEERVGAYIISL